MGAEKHEVGDCMARNRKLELNSIGRGRWMTSDRRFGVVRTKIPIEQMDASGDWQINYRYSIRDLNGESFLVEYMELAKEIGNLERFKDVFPWLGRYTGEGSFDTDDPERSVPKSGLAEDVRKMKDELI